MDHIRIRVSVHLNGNRVIDLNALKPAIERAIAGAFPADIAVDTVRVTRINEARPQEMGAGDGE